MILKHLSALIVFLMIGYSSVKGSESIDAVDLGLPSGTLWATCNIGASSPEEYGDYFAWGETSTKSYYYYNTYSWCNGNITTGLTKYCLESLYGDVDNLERLELSDDAAFVNWGTSWRMPSEEEMQELVDNCTWTWTSINSVHGYQITGSNGNSIFLPASGWIVGDEIRGQDDSWGTRGCYWTSSLSPSKNYDGKFLSFYYNSVEIGGSIRHCGHSIRPVKKETHEYVDLGLSSGTLWATCNIGASSPEEYGDYFAWGEIHPKSTYTWENYQWITEDSSSQISKYLKPYDVLSYTDDAATQIWGKQWVIPSPENRDELRKECNWIWSTVNGVNGYKVIGPNGNSIFLPAVGMYEDSNNGLNKIQGKRGVYWINRLTAYIRMGDNISFSSNAINKDGYDVRANGCAIRPVRTNRVISESGISSIKTDITTDIIFNIFGQPVDDSTKGLIIKNGRKFIIK